MKNKSETLASLFLKRVSKSPDNYAVTKIEKGKLNYYTNEEYESIVSSLSLGLMELGVKKGDKISILAQTSLEWHFLDLAILCSGLTVVPIYPTYLPHEVEYIFNHSESSILIVENKRQFNKIKGKFDNLQMIISIEKLSTSEIDEIDSPYKIINLVDLIKLGYAKKKKTDLNFADQIEKIQGSDIATIIYTSGTTGNPKGAIITHEAFVRMLQNVGNSFSNHIDYDDCFLIFLPLAHVFGRVGSLINLVFDSKIVFVKSVERLMSSFSIARPTVVFAVPRIFEKIYSELHFKVDKSSAFKKKIFSLALTSSNRYFKKIDNNSRPGFFGNVTKKIAFKLVFSKLNEIFGGRIRFFVSGGAPLAVDVIKFLRNANLTILEGYGLTETIGPCTVNPLEKQCVGTVGVPIGDVKVKFSEDNEILIKSKALMSGYYKDEEATSKSIKDGWFHTGDIGGFSEDGYLTITDRKKDIIITSGGKNVAPQKIENICKTKKYISQMVVVGDKRKYLTALIGIEKESLARDFRDLWGKQDFTAGSLALSDKVKKLVQKDIDEVNKDLSNFEAIKRFHIIPEELTIENGFLTSSLKVKRGEVLKRYESEVDAMYSN